MNNVQLELEKIIEYFNQQIDNRLHQCILPRTKEHINGELRAYTDAKEKCEKLQEVVIGDYHENDQR